MVHVEPTLLVYADANVLVAGLVRTLVLLCGPTSGYRTVWSPYAEREAARHQPAGALPISTVRELYDLVVVPDGSTPIPLQDTDMKDQPILASAAAAGATFVVSENVTDFGEQDLATLSMSVVHPDLFLATRVTADDYLFVLDAMCRKRTREPRTPVGIHALEVSRKLPLLYARRSEVLGVEPGVVAVHPAKVQFRGVRCIRCARAFREPGELVGGLCSSCHRLAQFR